MRTSSRMLAALCLSGFALAASTGCHRGKARPDPGIPYSTTSVSPKLSTFVFQEDGKLYLLTVGVNAARFHDKDPFVPLSVALVNKTTTPLSITRESFTLVDPVGGNRYGLATVDEARRQGKQVYDRQLMDVDHLASKLEIFGRLPSNFFPYEGLLNDQIELHQFQYMFDVLYFPRPEGQLLGKTFEL
ncbi:MAG TPA: hypothetical protein VFG76_09330, partial [Candidatus Polarisedimenticolia bacterium]|nr:hypothetical protein [Candidatus Polarisedimenticolia bacterium]